MKKIICTVLVMMFMVGCAWAEGTGTEAWQHEAGWLSFSVAISQEGSDEVWEQAAKIFGESVGVPMTGEMLKAGVMMGHTLENDVEDLSIEGNRFIGKKADGTELFSHEYTLAEVIEEGAVMNGEKTYVFKTEEADAGKYTYLLITEPVTTESEGVSYTTFNLVCTSKDDYRTVFDVEENGSPVAICAMVEKDASMEGLAYAVQKMFANPVVISQ